MNRYSCSNKSVSPIHHYISFGADYELIQKVAERIMQFNLFFKGHPDEEGESIEITADMNFGRKFARTHINLILKKHPLEWEEVENDEVGLGRYKCRFEENWRNNPILKQCYYYIEIRDELEMYNIPIIFNGIVDGLGKVGHEKVSILSKLPVLIYFGKELTVNDCYHKRLDIENEMLIEKIKEFDTEIEGLKKERQCVYSIIKKLLNEFDKTYEKSIIGKIRANSKIDRKTLEEYPELINSYKELYKLKAQFQDGEDLNL